MDQRIAVVGSRSFKNYEFLKSILDAYIGIVLVIVSGGAAGADKLAERWAKDNGVPLKVFYPSWKRYGKAAGPIRNQEIVDNCDFVIAFWDGKSRGTMDTLKKAVIAHKEVKIYWRGDE